MKKGLIWKILLFIGICPLAAPFLMSVTKPSSWTMLDWLVLYSFVYWPTYIVGLGLIALSIYKLKKK